jgi:hypothetical protein
MAGSTRPARAAQPMRRGSACTQPIVFLIQHAQFRASCTVKLPALVKGTIPHGVG